MDDANNAGKPADAADLANQALKAAQDAVASLKSGAGAMPAAASAPAGADDASSDAGMDPLAAAQAAIARAKEINAQAAAAGPSGATSGAGRAGGAGAAMIGGGVPPGAQPLNIPDFANQSGGAQPEGIDLLSDVNLHVKIELGRTRMLVEDVLRLGEGSVVELDKLAGDPVDVYVNDRHVARGEVLVLNDNFCVRINEIVAGATDGPVAGR